MAISPDQRKEEDFSDTEAQALFAKSRSLSPSLLTAQTSEWRMREVTVLGWRKEVITPNTARFQNRLLSRLLHKFPFLVEAWYWALIYWVRYSSKDCSALTKSGIGIPARSRIYRCDAGRGYRPCRQEACAPAHRDRKELAHLLGAADPMLLHAVYDSNAVDESPLLLHSYTWNHCIPGVAELLHDHAQSTRTMS